VSTDKELLQDVSTTVNKIEERLDVWCPIINRDVENLKATVNGRDGLETRVSYHAKLFAGMWAIALAVFGLLGKAIHDFIR
jgi:hypothetical protein